MSEQQTQASVTPPRQRRLRPSRLGVVTSDQRDKTITVTVSTSSRHPKYGKFIRSRTRYQVHDAKNECRVGDRVEIMECRPISKTKAWRLVRIIEAAPREDA